MDIYVDDYKDLIDGSDYTKAINKAIIDASKTNSKIIFKENKIYRSGTIFLYDNIELHFEKNSILKALDDIDKFNVNNIEFDKSLNVNTFINCDYVGKPYLYFIYGYNIKNIKFSGEGIIDGNEQIYYGEISDNYIEGKFYPRMPLIYLENVKNIEFNSITLRNSAFWTIHLVGCDTVLIDYIKIFNNRKMLNSDGIDPDHSKNIIIKNSIIEAADDCIVIKGTKDNIKYGDSYNINVSDCILKSTSAAIKIGTETFNNFYNINFKNIKISDTNRGISIMLRDSGNIKDVNFNNIEINTHMVEPKAFWGKAEAISITNVKRNNDIINGNINNISFNNIKCNSEHGIFIYGNDNIKDITFNNIELNLIDVTNYEKNLYDLRPNINNIVFKDKLSHIYIHKASNIKFNNYKDYDKAIIINNDTWEY